jgi:hypothetical protein
MLMLTLKERHLIDDAVLRFGNDREREIWRQWKLDHPAVRYDPNQDVDDGTAGRFPAYVSQVAVDALGRLERALRVQIDSAAISEDEAADLCNDMAEVQSTVEILRAA